jgi:hypothetical protein
MPAEMKNGHPLAQLLELGLNPDVVAKLPPANQQRHSSSSSSGADGHSIIHVFNGHDMQLGTPLHFAVHNAQAECVSMLVDVGADIFALDAAGMTPYMLAKRLLSVAGRGVEAGGLRVAQWRRIVHILVC